VKVLIINSHTLYLKSTLPVAIAMLKMGWDVTFSREKFRLLDFWKKKKFHSYILNNPTSVEIINEEATSYVARIIGQEEEWNEYKSKVSYSFFAVLKQKKFDLVLATIKNRNQVINRKNVILLGYEHLPILGRFASEPIDNYVNRKTIFFSDNQFTLDHQFSEIFKNLNISLLTFPWLDKVIQTSYKRNRPKIKKKVLIFHPGGYRNVLSSPGDDKKICYASQENFIEKICIPLIDKGFYPIIKVHPLRAIYHDKDDLDLLTAKFNSKYRNKIEILSADSWHWDHAYDSKFILTFGSSSIYDLWSAGIKNVFICNFFGEDRSKRFNYFDSVFINSHDDYIELVQKFANGKKIVFDQFTNKVMHSYSSICNGDSIPMIISEIQSTEN